MATSNTATTTQVQGGVSCFACKETGFFVTTPGGGNTTCPACGHGAYYYNDISKAQDEQFEKLIEDKIGDDTLVDYCDQCGILYGYDWCVHSEWGCTDSVYYGAFIHKYSIGDKVYNGMPRFESFNDMLIALSKMTVLEMLCHCNGGWNDCGH